MLFGIPNFYPKFGYATVIPEIWIDFGPEEAQAPVSTYQIRKFEMEDAPKILTLYAANNDERTGTLVKEETRWKGFNIRGSNFTVVTDPYVVLDEGRWGLLKKGEKLLVLGRYGASDFCRFF